jgi:hypothetical protein
MNYQELKTKLTITQGVLNLSQGTLTAGMGDFLNTCYGGQPLVITEVQPGPDGTAAQTIQLSGRSSFLNVPDLPVAASFSTDAQGEVHALLRYRLRDAAPGPGAWTFSRSFPQLPPVIDYDTPMPASLANFKLWENQRPFLDSLDLFDTFFVVATHAGKDPELGVPLEAGINFVSKLRPQGALGVLEHTLGEGAPLLLYGTIRLPKPTDITLPLQPMQLPWEQPSAPGIHLQAALDTNLKVGGMTFHRASFRIYSPASTEWMGKNPSFEPVHGYAGTLTIPSAGIELQTGAKLKWNMPEALLFAQCKGVSLGKLASLLDVAGTDGLTSHLPQELQKAVDALGSLELSYVAVDLGLSGFTPTVDTAYLTVGFPNLKWQVWEDHLVVEDLSCHFIIPWPFEPRSGAASGSTASSSASAPPVSVTMFGTLDIEGVPLRIRANNDRGFTIGAATQAPVRLPLNKLLTAHAPGIPAPSNLTINQLGASVSLGRSYSMSALLAGEPEPWTIPVGREKLTIEDVALNFSYPKGGPATGAFGGTIQFGDGLKLRAQYSVPGNFVVDGRFPKVNLSHLIEKLCDQKVELPGGFDLVLPDSAVLIQKQGDNYVFRLCSVVDNFGVFAFEVRKISGGKWGYAAGMDLGGSGLSKLPGLSELRVLEDAFKLQKLMLVVSSFEDASFQFPSLSQFNRPQLATKGLALSSQTGGVRQGLMLFAQWQLDTQDRKQNLLSKLLGIGGTQSVTLAISPQPMKGSKMYVSQRSTLQGLPFSYTFGVELQNGKPELFLTGSLTAKIQGQPQTFDVTMAFATGGAFFSGTMKGATAINCGPFKLSNLALEVGTNWAGIPSLGVAATIAVEKFQSSVAVFFDSADPSKSLVAGSLSDLTLGDVVDSLVGNVTPTSLDPVLKSISVKGTRQFEIPGEMADELDGLSFEKVSAAFSSAAKIQIPSSASQLLLVVNKKGSAWHLTDLTKMRHYQLVKRGDTIAVSIAPQFYFAPQATSIGTLPFPQGFYVNAAISFLGLKAEATIDISTNKGVSIDAQMDRIVLLNEKLFCIGAEKGSGGPKLSVSTFNQPDHPVKEFRAPHFYVNGSLTMLGIERGIYASLSQKGLVFDLQGALVPGVKFNVQATLGGAGLDASGEIKVGVGTLDLGALGKVNLNTDLEGRLEIGIDAKQARIAAEASFEFAGERVKIGKFNLEAKTDGLKELPDQMARRAEKELTAVFKDMNKWANAVKNGMVDGVQDTAKVFRDVYGQSAQQAQALAQSVGKGFNAAADATAKAAEEAAKQTQKAAEEAAKQAQKAAENAAKEAEKSVKSAGKSVEKTGKKIGKSIKKLF